MLSDTAEANFCPSLTEISRYLRLSPNVAGVTFLALGNGAPDIASIIAGVLSGSTGFGVGEPIGAGLFVTTSVMAAVTLLSEVTVDGAPFLRDAITYLISITFVFLLYLSGKIVLWQSLLCLLIYFAYVASVIIGRFVYLYVIKPRHDKQLANKEKQETPREDTGLIVHEDDEDEIDDHASWYGDRRPLGIRKPANISHALEKEIKRSESTYFGATYFPKVGLIYERKPRTIVQGATPVEEENETRRSIIITEHFKEDHGINDDEEEEEHENESEMVDYSGCWGGFKRRRDTFLNWIEWDDKSIFQKIFYLFEWPTILLRNLTIPKADPDDWSKFFAVISPPFMGPFILLALQRLDMTVGQSPMPLWALLAIIGLVPSLLILFTTNRRTPPKYHFLFVFVAFGMSILWIMIVANELVGLLQSMGVMWRVSDGILAMTVLAWGNSLGDLVSDVVISRQGFPSMAVGAVYSGPCLNLLIGLGLSITTHCVTKAPAFIITASPTVTMSFIFLLASMISAVLIITICRFRAPKPFGILLLAIYVAFMVLSILIEAELIFTAV
jgi:sodium/potassium/calcium exchanger 6